MSKISQNRQKKIELVEKIAQKLADAKSVILADYRGLTVGQMSQLRHKIREKSAELHVIKNTLLKLALKRAKYPKLEEEVLEGPTATLFSFEDEIAALKELDSFAQTYELPKIKAGFLGLQLLPAETVQRLAKLPTREVLLGQTVGAVASPLYGIVSVLQANIRNLIFTLDQISKIKNQK